MKYPRIKSAVTIDEHTLMATAMIEFDNNLRKKHDIAPLLEKEIFSIKKTRIIRICKS
jgi:hypothetical protein